MNIVQGNNGQILTFFTEMDLDGAIVSVVIDRQGELIDKDVEIVDSVKGKCRFTLLESDLTIVGAYKFQWTAIFGDGRKISDKPIEFYVYGNLKQRPIMYATVGSATVGTAIVS